MESKIYQIYNNQITEAMEKEKRCKLYMEKLEYRRVIKEAIEMPEIAGEEYVKGYIKEVLDNYNNMGIEDRLKVNEILEKFYKDNEKCCSSHEYTFKHLNIILENMLRAKKFPELYNSLNKMEKQEMDEQILNSCMSLRTNDYAYDRDLIGKMLGLDYDGEIENPSFVLDEVRLKKELANDELVPNYILNVFKVKYGECAVNEVDYYKYKDIAEEKLLDKYAKPLVIEFKNIMNDMINFIISNTASYTSNSYRLRDLEDQILVFFNINYLTKEDLDFKISSREQRLRERSLYIKEQERQKAEARDKAKKKEFKSHVNRRGSKGRR